MKEKKEREKKEEERCEVEAPQVIDRPSPAPVLTEIFTATRVCRNSAVAVPDSNAARAPDTGESSPPDAGESIPYSPTIQ